MRILVVGAGAIGGTIAVRLAQAGLHVSVAVRDRRQVFLLEKTGLQVSGIGGNASIASLPIAILSDYPSGACFDLVLLATKAHDALAVAHSIPRLISKDGVLLALQNGCAQLDIARQLGECVLGGIAYLGARMIGIGSYVQGTSGRLIIAEPLSRQTDRAERVATTLGKAVRTDVSADFAREMWAKLAINTSVSSVSAVIGRPIREFVDIPTANDLLMGVYNETISVANAHGVHPESFPLAHIVAQYGELKPSMLQDIERNRKTEVDFINGYVVREGHRRGINTPLNAGIVEWVHAIEEHRARPSVGWEALTRSAMPGRSV